jgi:transcriptional regulator with XRE-family HTH domain
MALKALAMLGAKLKHKRGAKKLREVASEIGVSAATLLRVESGRIPDVETFGKMCQWLGESPSEYLGFNPPKTTNPARSSSLREASAHFKVDRHANPETAVALAKMILYASEHQAAPSESDE